MKSSGDEGDQGMRGGRRQNASPHLLPLYMDLSAHGTDGFLNYSFDLRDTWPGYNTVSLDGS